MTLFARSMDSSNRVVAEAAWESRDACVQSIATRRPRSHAVRSRDASHLPFRLPARPSSGAPRARGLLSAFWEWGSPDLPARGPRGGSTSGPVRPIFIRRHPRPSRGAKPRGADDTRHPQERPHQEGSRGGGEIKATSTSRGARDASHDDRDQAGARRAPPCALSLFPLWCKGGQAQARSTEASGKGFHIGAT